MHFWTIKSARNLLLATTITGFSSLANAATTWALQSGSSFYDASTDTTIALTGSMTSHLVDFSNQEPYSSHGWNYIRHDIDQIDIRGIGIQFTQAFFGGDTEAGGAIDISDQGQPLQIIQVQIIFQDGTRFEVWPANYTGAPYAPSSISLANLAPFDLHENPYYLGQPLDIQSDDRLNLFLTPVPEPETYALLLAGLGLIGWKARRKAAQNGFCG